MRVPSHPSALLGLLGVLVAPLPAAAQAAAATPLFHDAHFHLTNYIQEGTDIRAYLEIMGARIGRSTLFGIPLQQTWSYQNSGDYGPTYYLAGVAGMINAHPDRFLFETDKRGPQGAGLASQGLRDVPATLGRTHARGANQDPPGQL